MQNGSIIRGTKGVLLFFLRFLAASVLLYLLYIWAGIYYMRLVAYGARPLLAISGYRFVMEPALRITEEISLNPVVFFSLVIAVSNVRIRTRLRAAMIGFLILTAANSITVFLSFLSAYRNSEQLWTGTEFFNLTINFFLPLLLWFLLLPLRSLVFQPRRTEE
jgi:hypothetical protein